jgi:hypothetical protein
MSFRSDPLPSYEDIISGNFPKNTKIASSETENIQNGTNDQVLGIEDGAGDFKYKTVNKISEQLEDGEYEEGELEEDSGKYSRKDNKDNKSTKMSNNPNNTKNNQRNNKNNVKVQKPEKRSKTDGPNFTANIKNAAEKTPFVPRLVCRYFMEGICSKGDKCTFSHSVVPNKTPEEAKVKEPCKFFIAGSCMKGEGCYFSHDLSVVPCKFFHLRGECSAIAKGGACRFSHDPIDKETLEKLRSAEAERIKEKMAAEATIVTRQTTSNNTGSLSATEPEQPQTCKETETPAECPHEVELLNPFAGDDYEDY